MIMSEVSTIVCPNCGASTSNIHNCEFCGSALVQFAAKDVAVDSSKYGKEAKAIPGLVDAIKNNILLQKNDFGTDVPITEVIQTTCLRQYSTYQLMPISLANLGLNINNPFSEVQTKGIVLRIPFLVRSADSSLANEHARKLSIFKQLDCFPLFSEASVKEGVFYFLQFGEDYETAAKLLTSAITEIDNCSDISLYSCSTHYINIKQLGISSTGIIEHKKAKFPIGKFIKIYLLTLIILGAIIILITSLV